MSKLNETTEKWVRNLPTRWAIGGLVLGLIWSIISNALQGSFSDPVGGQLAGLPRVAILIVLPLYLLGFLWGWTERSHLEIRYGGALESAARRSILRHIGKAMIRGMIFGLFVYGTGYFRSFQPWDSADNISANVTSVLGFASLALPFGLIVGVITRFKLLRGLSDDL